MAKSHSAASDGFNIVFFAKNRPSAQRLFWIQKDQGNPLFNRKWRESGGKANSNFTKGGFHRNNMERFRDLNISETPKLLKMKHYTFVNIGKV